MQITKVFETSDGHLFRERESAKRHEAWLGLRIVARRLLEVAGHEPDERDDVDAAMATEMASVASDLAKLLRAEPADMREP